MSPFAWAVLIVLLWIAAFGLIWCGVCVCLSVVSGWRRLAKVYRATKMPVGVGIPRQSVRMRGNARYKHCVSIMATSDGLGITVASAFRWGHPPLFIPWCDVTAKRADRSFEGDQVTLNFAQCPEIPFRVSVDTADHIARGAAASKDMIVGRVTSVP